MKTLPIILLIIFSVNSLAENTLTTQAEGVMELGTKTQLHSKYRTGDSYMGIRFLGTLSLSGKPVNNFSASELSGIAWDEDEGILYAISDRGYLLHLKPEFKHNSLENISLINAFSLKNKSEKRLKRAERDAEGLTVINSDNGIAGDSELLISFELTPRIQRFSNTGKLLGDIRLPAALNNDAFRHNNGGLESVIIHPEFGILTAPQIPLENEKRTYRTIHNMQGKIWRFIPLHQQHSSITDLELTNKQHLLILERKYSNVFLPIQYVLRTLDLTGQAQQNNHFPTKVIAKMSSLNGWKLDNFEGLAYHKNNRYFLVSDDNQNLFQRTLLVYFELITDQE